eukprot:TRINITY_DN91587_c0_g1_i1.p1 TRINITY_DN91587_c0_g1~~TRINITY_DN91587_c0_g1_i1.p1  ORF type:complete len:747 (-),score=115.08 TRINITY_DN91587_c0_g1_i1:83-2323(-)
MDNYVLVERLGQGSFAVVWKARRKADYKLVAVKQLKQTPSTWEECKRLPEIRAAAATRGCPYVIALLEAVRHGSELFLVLEYADCDLCRCLGPNRRIEEPHVRWVMRQLLTGLAAVHQAGLVHCDVKPENLLLFRSGGPGNLPVLKLCDLGQATPAGEVPSYVGTRWYRAPELLMGRGRAGEEVDLWAAGCAMAELILLRPCFPGTDTRDMLFRICSALGAPEDGWFFSEQLMEASGLRFAPCAAEGPVWFELASAGASPPSVELVRGLLRYNQETRISASGGLAGAFFAGAPPEAPVLPPEDKAAQSVERLQRSRDEAKAVERKLHKDDRAKGGMTMGMPSGLGLGGGSLGGLGCGAAVFGDVSEVAEKPRRTGSNGIGAHHLAEQGGLLGPSMRSGAMRLINGLIPAEPGTRDIRANSDGLESLGGTLFGGGGSSSSTSGQNRSKGPPVLRASPGLGFEAGAAAMLEHFGGSGPGEGYRQMMICKAPTQRPESGRAAVAAAGLGGLRQGAGSSSTPALIGSPGLPISAAAAASAGSRAMPPRQRKSPFHSQEALDIYEGDDDVDSSASSAIVTLTQGQSPHCREADLSASPPRLGISQRPGPTGPGRPQWPDPATSPLLGPAAPSADSRMQRMWTPPGTDVIAALGRPPPDPYGNDKQQEVCFDVLGAGQRHRRRQPRRAEFVAWEDSNGVERQGPPRTSEASMAAGHGGFPFPFQAPSPAPPPPLVAEDLELLPGNPFSAAPR